MPQVASSRKQRATSRSQFIPRQDADMTHSRRTVLDCGLDTLIEAEAQPVRSDGDWRFPRALLGGLHKMLFG